MSHYKIPEEIYSDEIWDYFDDSNRDKIFLYDMGYGQQRGQGQLKFFRSSGNIYFALNNNLLDTTKDHYFENNTLLLNSYLEFVKKYFPSVLFIVLVESFIIPPFSKYISFKSLS